MTVEDGKAAEQVVKRPTCGLIMPISGSDEYYTEQHWADVRSILEEAIRHAGYEPRLVSDMGDAGVIQNTIVQNLLNDEMIVCDCSSKNANVMLEFGLRMAFNKPVVPVFDKETDYPFDATPLKYVDYPRALHYLKVQNFKKRLSETITATYSSFEKEQQNSFLKVFGKFEVAKLERVEVSTDKYILDALNSLEKKIANMASQQSVGPKRIYLTSTQARTKAAWVKPLRINIDSVPPDTMLTLLTHLTNEFPEKLKGIVKDNDSGGFSVELSSKATSDDEAAIRQAISRYESLF